MKLTVLLIVLVTLILLLCSFRVEGNAVMIQPYFEVRQVPHAAPFPNAHYVPVTKSNNVQHGTSQVTIKRLSSLENDLNFLSRDALHNYTKEATEKESTLEYGRAADHTNNSPYTLYHRPSQYEYQEAPTYSSVSSSYVSADTKDMIPVQETTTKIPFPGLDLTSLLTPVTSKIANKATGLMDLILALLSSSSSKSFEIKGFKDLVVNGIVRPLLIAKGGIKTLISKLAIPIISLLLIHLEVLVTVWWLWDDCPLQKQQTSTNSYPNPSYNNYNTSYR